MWDTASRSTKRQDMLEILGGTAPFAPPGYANVQGGDLDSIVQGVTVWMVNAFK